jgi:hypothetical protein
VSALAQIDRLEDVEIERVLDVASDVARGQLDVHDPGILRVERIDLAERLAHNLLVLSDTRPRVTAERRRFRGGDLDLRDVRLRHSGRADGGQREDDGDLAGNE